MGILSWIVFGLLAGIIARLLMPGKGPKGIVMTMILGIVGAVLGGYIGTLFGFGDLSGFDLRSMGLAVGGACLVIFISAMLNTRG